jgi:hypothetical protein
MATLTVWKFDDLDKAEEATEILKDSEKRERVAPRTHHQQSVG